MKLTILTLFPQQLQDFLSHSIVRRAVEKKLVEIQCVDIRDFGIGSHKTVDDKPYGGGVGMVLRADVVINAIQSVKDPNLSKNEQLVLLTDARGITYTQEHAQQFSKLQHLIVVCGHYEGVDERVLSEIDMQVSIGDYVLTGGEIPSLVIADSVIRLIPGVLKPDATKNESFSPTIGKQTREHPQYTRPQTLNNQTVPEVLLSGDHSKISKWKLDESKRSTGGMLGPSIAGKRTNSKSKE